MAFVNSRRVPAKKGQHNKNGAENNNNKTWQILVVFVFSLVCARTSMLPKNRTRVRLACRICRFPLHPFCYAIGPLHAVMDIVKLFLPTTMFASLHIHVTASSAISCSTRVYKTQGFRQETEGASSGVFPLLRSIFLP